MLIIKYIIYFNKIINLINSKSYFINTKYLVFK